jgi:transposase InsO family protein
VIKRNAHKYSISAQCKCLGVARASYYRNRDKSEKQDKDADLRRKIEEVFLKNRGVFGARKIKRKLLTEHGIVASRRRIGRNMSELGVESVYQKKKPKRPKPQGNMNESPAPNLLKRNFDDKRPYEVIVSDLTYARVHGRWHYVCILLDLFNREIAGHSAGPNKDAVLVQEAFARVKIDLGRIKVFHSDRGGEFDNMLIDELLGTFGIDRSLSMKACPYDNAVAEAAFKMIKTEFVYRQTFDSIEHLRQELNEYVRWYNEDRPHSTLGYLTPIEYREQRT